MKLPFGKSLLSYGWLKRAWEREFCFWMVGSRDGKVRKLRFSFGALFGCALAGFLVASFFIFIASDYGRLQLQRAVSHLQLRRLSVEHERLQGVRDILEGQVMSLQRDKEKSRSYEEQVRGRLDELAALIGAFALDPKTSKAAESAVAGSNLALGIGNEKGGDINETSQDAQVSAGQEDSSLGGIGGAELDICRRQNGDCISPSANNTSLDIEQLTFGGVSLLDGTGAETGRSLLALSQSDLVTGLDRLIYLIKVLPVALPAHGHVNSKFGYRASPFHGSIKMHEGIDIALAGGSSIMATADGVIQQVKYCPTYGLMVDIAHSDKVTTRYAHLSKTFVSEGEKVCRGEIIGLAGSTGRSTGPHLHYEVRVDGEAQNPQAYFDLASHLTSLYERII